jgi:hypothetical protein
VPFSEPKNTRLLTTIGDDSERLASFLRQRILPVLASSEVMWPDSVATNRRPRS